MDSFEDFEKLISDLETGNTTPKEAEVRIDAALAFLFRLMVSLTHTRENLQKDPQALQKMRAEVLTDELFQGVRQHE